MEEVCNTIILGIKDYFRKNNFKKAVIGLSGGVDSSVSACITAKALGNRNVTGILMPHSSTTSRGSIDDAKNLAAMIGIKIHLVSLDDFAGNFKKISSDFLDSENYRNALSYSLANVKARLRMIILYCFANLNNALVIGTSDKSEIALGYTTKYGDNAADIMVIGDLWKTEVIELARRLRLPSSIIIKEPSAELVEGQTAEKELGAPYEILDRILKMQIIDGLSTTEIVKRGMKPKIVRNVLERIRLNEHKRRSPPIIRLSERSFHSMEWRMPITNGFRS